MRTFHLAFSSYGRHRPFPGQAELRDAIHRIVRIAGHQLQLFGIAGEHAHVLVRCDRGRAGLLARALLKGLRVAAPRGRLQPAQLQPVQDEDHLAWLQDHLLLLPQRQGCRGHPALWEGSPLPDLIGARHLPGYAPEADPATLSRALALLGLPTLIEPMDPSLARRFGIGRITTAAAAAMAAPPGLTGRSSAEVTARRAAARLGRRAGLPSSELAWAFGQSRRTAYRLAAAPVAGPALRALQLRLGLEARVEASAAGLHLATEA
jgi:hypothetical protein